MRFKPAVDSLEQRDTPSGFTAVAPLAVTAQVDPTYRPPPSPWSSQSSLYQTTYSAATNYFTSALVAYPIDQLS